MFSNKKLAVAVSGAVLLMAGQFALADSTTDIVDALVSKGILTEEEGKLISKGAKSQKEAQDKAIKSAGKIKISDAIESATLYGDLRARFEDRQATGFVNGSKQGSATLERFRGKFVLGMEMKSGDWYSDFALSTGAKGRSDNFNFGSSNSSGGLYSSKSGDQAIAVNKLMIGWNATPWLDVQVGRMKNPLYTNQMVWDADLPIEGLSENIKYDLANAQIFASLNQIAYQAGQSTPNIYYNDGTTVATTNHTVQLFANQVGIKGNLTDNASGKAAITYYSYNESQSGGNPAAGTGGALGSFKPGLASSTYTATQQQGVNNLSIIEIPAEVNYFLSGSNVGIRLFGDYAINTTADQRAHAANASWSAGSDDHAYAVGFTIASAKDLKSFEGNKLKEGDWSARVWYQEIGLWALDPNTPDSDFMDGRVNTKGVVAKGQYNIRDNVLFNVSAGYGMRKNNLFQAAGYGDMGFDFSHMGLVQTDITWKF